MLRHIYQRAAFFRVILKGVAFFVAKKGEIIMAKRLIDYKELTQYLGLGRNRAVSFAKANGCEIRIGRRVLYDLAKLDAVIDNMHTGDNNND